MSDIRFVDTTIRDGQLSLWAMAMRTEMMLPIIADLDAAGFAAIEIVGSSFFKKIVRELGQDPFERIRQVAGRLRHTPLRAIRTRHIAAFQITPDAISQLWMERLAAAGVREIRISDPSNTPSEWGKAVAGARRAGLKPIVNFIYSVSPKHTDAYYAQRAREAVALGADAFCLKDPSGLLTPERMRTLVPTLERELQGAPIELHSHCNAGLGALCAQEAVRLGWTVISTAVPPLAEGSSLPSVFTVARNARALGHRTLLDEARLRPVSEHLARVAAREGFPLGAPASYDAYHYRHQVPGGMTSNLRFQLGKLGMEDRLDDVLAETVRVRAEFGYPVMVTPYSQFVGSQAALNIMCGERYAQVTDEAIQYALGHWGAEEAESMDPNVRDRLVGLPRARELADWRAPNPSLAQVREQLGGSGIGDDELLLRFFAGADAVAAMKKSEGAAPRPPAPVEAARLIGAFAAGASLATLSLRQGGVSLDLRRRL